MVGLLFDKEATTFFYNCVFNLMDSLMRFAVLHPAARELAGEGESARSDEGGRGTKGSRARGCVHARANECKRGWWIWAREAGWQPRHTTREATRAFPMPGTTSLSHPPSLSVFLSLFFLLTFSVVLLQSVRRAHLHFSGVPSSAEKQFSLHMSPTSVIVRFFSLSQTISAVPHKKRNRKFMTVLGSFGRLTFLLLLYQSEMGFKNYSNSKRVIIN